MGKQPGRRRRQRQHHPHNPHQNRVDPRIVTQAAAGPADYFVLEMQVEKCIPVPFCSSAPDTCSGWLGILSFIRNFWGTG